MTPQVYRGINSVLRKLGISVCRYKAANSDQAQLNKALDLVRTDLIFDIGANEGQFARGVREHGYSGKIVSFEPLSIAREKLLLHASQDHAWEVHAQTAIGDHTSEVTINIAGNSVSSSVLQMLNFHSEAAIGSAYVGSERVSMVKLDCIVDGYLKDHSSLFIKIDTQGFEWQVLNGAAETLRRASGVFCELSLVPLYRGQRLWRDIVCRLEEEGFMLWALQKGFTDPRTGQTLQMDGIFLRRERLIRDVSDVLDA